MQCSILVRENGKDPAAILTAFLGTVPAIVRYGRTVIYADDVYYIPYRRKVFCVRETGEAFAFLCSCVSESIAVMAMPGSESGRNFTLEERETQDRYAAVPTRSTEEMDEEIRQQMQLDHTIRKVLRRYHLEETAVDLVYIAEPTFCVHGKSDYIFLVDPVLEKVDFSNYDAVQRIIARRYLEDHPMYPRAAEGLGLR